MVDWKRQLTRKLFFFQIFFVFGWGGKALPDPPPLNDRSSHLIEAAKRGRLDQMIFFFGAADDTCAARTSGWASADDTVAADDRPTSDDTHVPGQLFSCTMFREYALRNSENPKKIKTPAEALQTHRKNTLERNSPNEIPYQILM